MTPRALPGGEENQESMGFGNPGGEKCQGGGTNQVKYTAKSSKTQTENRPLDFKHKVTSDHDKNSFSEVSRKEILEDCRDYEEGI
jgi:hypothetical protein